MSALEESPAAAAVVATGPEAEHGHGDARRGVWFWIRRYLPAEIVGTAALMLAGYGVTAWTDAPAAVAAAALVGEIIGFYTVLAVTIYLEQIHVVRKSRGLPRSRRRASLRTALLLVAEFGPSELLDTLLIRPVALMLGVLLLRDAFWGLLAGKVAADIVFYAIAAGAFTVTARSGLRDASRDGAA